MLQTDKYIKYGTEMLIKLGSTDKFLCSENFLSHLPFTQNALVCSNRNSIAGHSILQYSSQKAKTAQPQSLPTKYPILTGSILDINRLENIQGFPSSPYNSLMTQPTSQSLKKKMRKEPFLGSASVTFTSLKFQKMLKLTKIRTWLLNLMQISKYFYVLMFSSSMELGQCVDTT